ncbi:MAG TPA: hypothetical protein VFY93_06915 [Planctomycetota bacterium]|nr:hypothetical protein [Planctomycetota bacterium]
MAFRDQIRRNRRRLLFFLLAALALSAIAGRVVGKALLFTVDPEQYYGVAESWWAYYPNHVAGSLMLLVWVQYVRMRVGRRHATPPREEMGAPREGREVATAPSLQ